MTPAEARNMLADVKANAPDLYAFIRALFEAGLIDGMRCVLYARINGREHGVRVGPVHVR